MRWASVGTTAASCSAVRNDVGPTPGVEESREMIVEPRVEEYAEAHTSPDGELFERLAIETRETSEIPQMMVGHLQGQFLAFLVRAMGARRVLEIGTFTGYSSISMARALPQ